MNGIFSKKFFSVVFGFVGVALSVIVVGASFFGWDGLEGEMIQVVAIGVAALACFKSSEFLAK